MLTLWIAARLKNPGTVTTKISSKGLRLLILTIFVVLNSPQHLDIKSKFISTFILICEKLLALPLLNTGSGASHVFFLCPKLQLAVDKKYLHLKLITQLALLGKGKGHKLHFCLLIEKDFYVTLVTAGILKTQWCTWIWLYGGNPRCIESKKGHVPAELSVSK